LDRGYAVVHKVDGSVVRSPEVVTKGEELDVRVAKGRIKVKVESGKGKDSEKERG
jgi:exodeoxyribonuclease VII large subunit